MAHSTVASAMEMYDWYRTMGKIYHRTRFEDYTL